MSTRRFFLMSALSMPFAAALPMSAFAGQPVTVHELKDAFISRDQSVREMIQSSMKAEGLYTRGIDGAWGQGMEKAYKSLMTSSRYKKAAASWTWAHEVQVVETLMFFTSDAYIE